MPNSCVKCDKFLKPVLGFARAVQSDTGCSYTDVYSNMNTIVLFSMLVWAPLSGWLTDVYAKQQHWFLLWCSIAEAASLVAMLMVILYIPSFNPWVILGIQVRV